MKLKIMRDDIVDFNSVHTMTSRIMNSMQEFWKIINFYYFSYFYKHIFHIFSYPYSFKMLSFYDHYKRINMLQTFT